MSGRLGSLSEKQEQALKEMLDLFPFDESKKTSDLDYDDYRSDLLRFLRARQFDVEKAASMYTDTLEWRKEVGADDILNDPEIAIGLDETFHEVISHSFHMYDKVGKLFLLSHPWKVGRPVYYEVTGAINMQHLAATFTPEQLIRRHIWYMELNAARMRKSPKGIWSGGSERVEQILHISDLKGLSLNPASHMAIMNVFKVCPTNFWVLMVFQECTRIDQTYYPERMGKMVMIRAPPLFYTIWKIIAPLLDKVTKEKIMILGDDYEDVLLDLIDADQLPVEYGGTCSCQGGCIPVYLDREVYVGAGSKHHEEVELGPQGSKISWSYQTGSHDISFGVIHKHPSGDEIVLSPPTRHKNSTPGSLKGSIEVPDSGSVALVFDNSYSYLTGKNVKFRVDVEHKWKK